MSADSNAETLPLDASVIAENVGFRSPLRVRARLLWRGLTLRARAFQLNYEDEYGPLRAFGWQDCRSHKCYVIRVEEA